MPLANSQASKRTRVHSPWFPHGSARNANRSGPSTSFNSLLPPKPPVKSTSYTLNSLPTPLESNSYAKHRGWDTAQHLFSQVNFFVALAAVLLLLCLPCNAQSRRKIIINQDCSGPGGSNMQTLARPDAIPASRSLRHHRRQRQRLARRRSRPHPPPARNYRPHRHSRPPRRGFPAGPHARRSAPLARPVRQSWFCRRLGSLAGGTNRL